MNGRVGLLISIRESGKGYLSIHDLLVRGKFDDLPYGSTAAELEKREWSPSKYRLDEKEHEEVIDYFKDEKNHPIIWSGYFHTFIDYLHPLDRGFFERYQQEIIDSNPDEGGFHDRY